MPEQSETTPVVDVTPDPRLHTHEPPFGIVEGCAECAAKLAVSGQVGSGERD